MQAQLDVFKKQVKQKRQAEDEDDITKLIKGGTSSDQIPDLNEIKVKKSFYNTLTKETGLPNAPTSDVTKDLLEELKAIGVQSGNSQVEKLKENETSQILLRQEKASSDHNVASTILYNFEPQKKQNNQQIIKDDVYALSNKVLSLKQAEMEGAIIKIQKQLELISVLQGRIYQQEKDIIILKSKVADLEKNAPQFPFSSQKLQKNTDHYQRRSLSSQFQRNSLTNEFSSPYRGASDQYTQIIREQREQWKQEESQQMQDYIQQRQFSSEASYNHLNNPYSQENYKQQHEGIENHSFEHNKPQNYPQSFNSSKPFLPNNQSYSHTNPPSNAGQSFSQNYTDRHSPSLSGRGRQRQVLRSSYSREESQGQNNFNSPDSASKYDRKLLDPQKISKMIEECNMQAQQLSRK